MKYIKLIVIASACAVLSSCGLAKSAARIPGSFLGAVGRTAGMNINHEEPKKTDAEKQQEVY